MVAAEAWTTEDVENSVDANPAEELYFEERIDVRHRIRRGRVALALLIAVAPLIDYLGSLAGDPVQPDIWLPAALMNLVGIVALPKVAFWPHPYLRVVGTNIEIRILRIPPRKIPVDSVWKTEVGQRRGRSYVDLNRTSFLSGDRFTTSSPHEFIAAIERAQHDLRDRDLQQAREESPGFRSEGEFVFERRLSIVQALSTKRFLGFVALTVLFTAPSIIEVEPIRVSWFGLAGLLAVVAFIVGATLLRRDITITFTERTLDIRGVFLRRKTLETSSIQRVEVNSAGMFQKQLLIHYLDKKERTLAVPLVDPEDALPVIRRAVRFFTVRHIQP